MNSLSRRRFLKISGATIAFAGAATSMGTFVKGAEKVEEKTGSIVKGIQKIPTYCDVCFWKCGAIAYVKDGNLWKIEGNPDDPLSNGRLCPRGTGGIGASFDKDRLRAPLMRKSVRGEDKWVEVTWDEALGYIADKMKKIKVEYGPEAMALFSHGVGGNFFKHTIKAYGSPNITAPSFAQCRGPRETGFELTFGDVLGSPERTDIKNAKCLVLLGSHLGENMHNTQVQEFAEAVENDASIIVVDPRFSVAASKAKYFLPIKPGTDMALLLAWMNVIVKEELYDKEYVEKFEFGFEQFAAEIAENTPEWAYPVTGIDPKVIRETAREMAKNKPASLVHPGRHTTWYGDDAQRSRAIALLNALLGSWGRKGGFYTPYSTRIPGYPYPAYPKSEKGTADNPNHKYPFAEGELISTGLREATITGNPYPIKGWLVYATNLMQSLPNREETIKAIQNLDLMVVVDVVPSEITGWADVVLPESTYLERYDDLNTAPFRESFVSLRQPVIDSPNDQKPNWWMAKKLAEKLGLGNYYPWKNIEEYLDTRLKSAGLSLEIMKKKGVVKGPKQPIFYEDGVPPVFWTPSGKIEFYSLRLKEHGFDPVPKFTKHEEPPAGYFRLLFGRAPVHTFAKTQSNPILKDMMEENELWVNNDIARRYGLKSGQYIKLKNTDGIVSNKIKVKATERIRTDCVYMVHGFGQNSKRLRSTFLKGASDSQLVTKYNTDPLMGGTGMNVNFVTFEWEA
ncbi:MAG: molybdopterin-dependent oxidoreductase [Melioribacteraceae bacterium]|nr:molybdopterin-dependent oxidoreductase [Melioribacteraceae bacterium]MCF8353313.1 molybdopterin-dependent oxidoreductase [Melioribacteraceae bacterium]MCF8393177.1 molybdopterin-dependent oxidoreductase [Melioribacteraceae bacterium]MCF8419039.1 molybdopterin-dependent oxidoreductase [Melioribacteraceae bacterium]